MCRFLLAKSKSAFKPFTLLHPFAKMAKKSKAYDGDWQGDGWGLSWIDKKGEFKTYKSLKPIWEESAIFNNFPLSTHISIHARSSSFPHDKGIIMFNQPFINNSYSFVFNGLLKGVSLRAPGTIGAEKIWNLLKEYLKKNDPIQALGMVKNLLLQNAREIQSLNIGLDNTKNIYALNFFTKHPRYYNLHYVNTERMKIISSEPIAHYSFQSVASGTIISL